MESDTSFLLSKFSYKRQCSNYYVIFEGYITRKNEHSKQVCFNGIIPLKDVKSWLKIFNATSLKQIMQKLEFELIPIELFYLQYLEPLKFTALKESGKKIEMRYSTCIF